MVLWVLACCYSFSSFSEEVKLTSPNHTTVHDDHYAEVPLQFVFPFYGEEFNTSYMFTNGVVGFRNPTDSQVESHWCCNGLDLDQMADNNQDISRYGYAIAPLWTDLIDLETGNSGLFAEGDTLQQTYIWKNLAEYSYPYDATTLNSFKLQIKQDGSYTVDYTAVDIQNHAIAIGEAGNLSTGVYQGIQNYYYPSGYTGIPESYGNEQNSINVLNTLCAANALYDPQCSGYSEAYAQQLFEQECMYNPQYDPTCNGYVDMEEQEVVQLTELVDDGSSAGSIEEAIEQPNIVTDFANTSGYEIEGMPSASAPLFEMPIVFEPEVFEQELPEVANEMQQMEQELEMEMATVEPEPQTEQEPQPIELEQDQEPQPEMAEEPVEEIISQEEEEVAVEEELELIEDSEVETEVATKQKDIKTKTTVKLLPIKKEQLTKNQKLKVLVAKKANALTKKIESAVTLEQQILVQQQLLSLISFVPNFNYADSKMEDRASFYPPNALADSSFSRWFRTDPNFEVLEDSQYPQRDTQWQR